jgi:stage IV sporulation protein A
METFRDVKKVREAKNAMLYFSEYDFISKAVMERIDLGEGNVLVELRVPEGLFYNILSEESGIRVEGEHVLIGMMKDLARIKREYERLEYAIHQVQLKDMASLHQGGRTVSRRT